MACPQKIPITILVSGEPSIKIFDDMFNGLFSNLQKEVLHGAFNFCAVTSI